MERNPEFMTGMVESLRLERRPGRVRKEYQLYYPSRVGKKRTSSISSASIHSSFRHWMKRVMRLFLVLLLFVMAGCFDYHEVESVTLVSGIGVIMEEETMVVHLELIEKGRIPSEGEGIKTIVTKGENFGDAIRNIVLQNGKRPYFGHAQVLIVDEGALPLLPDIVDDLLAQKEIRYDLQLVVARDAVDALFEQNEELRAFDLYELLKMNRVAATSTSMRLLDFMEQQDRAYLLPIITMSEEQATLREGAMLVIANEEQREVDASFVGSYLMLDGLFEFSFEMIKKAEGKAIYSELTKVKTKYKRQSDAALIDITGTLFITEEDQDGAIKQTIEQRILDDVQQFLVENETLKLIDVGEKLGSRKFMEAPNQPLPKVFQVKVDIDVMNASNVRRGR